MQTVEALALEKLSGARLESQGLMDPQELEE